MPWYQIDCDWMRDKSKFQDKQENWIQNSEAVLQIFIKKMTLTGNLELYHQLDYLFILKLKPDIESCIKYII